MTKLYKTREEAKVGDAVVLVEAPSKYSRGEPDTIHYITKISKGFVYVGVSFSNLGFYASSFCGCTNKYYIKLLASNHEANKLNRFHKFLSNFKTTLA